MFNRENTSNLSINLNSKVSAEGRKKDYFEENPCADENKEKIINKISVSNTLFKESLNNLEKKSIISKEIKTEKKSARERTPLIKNKDKFKSKEKTDKIYSKIADSLKTPDKPFTRINSINTNNKNNDAMSNNDISANSKSLQKKLSNNNSIKTGNLSNVNSEAKGLIKTRTEKIVSTRFNVVESRNNHNEDSVKEKENFRKTLTNKKKSDDNYNNNSSNKNNNIKIHNSNSLKLNENSSKKIINKNNKTNINDNNSNPNNKNDKLKKRMESSRSLKSANKNTDKDCDNINSISLSISNIMSTEHNNSNISISNKVLDKMFSKQAALPALHYFSKLKYQSVIYNITK